MIPENMPAICIGVTELKDNDKQLTLFTLQKGKIFAKIRGVKKKDAKLKFAAQPFCFGEYAILESNENFSVTGCNLINSFYELTADLSKYYAGSIILDSLSVIPFHKPEGEIFFNALRFLNVAANGKVNQGVLISKYLIKYFALNGRKLSFDECSSCGKKVKLLYYNFESGAICEDCINQGRYAIDSIVLNYLKQIDSADEDNLEKFEYKSKALSILSKTAIEQYGMNNRLLSMLNLNL